MFRNSLIRTVLPFFLVAWGVLACLVQGASAGVQERTEAVGDEGLKLGGIISGGGPIRLGRGAPGLEVGGTLVAGWDGGWRTRPKVSVQVEPEEAGEWVSYGPGRLKRNGEFEVKVPLGVKRGRLVMATGGYRFLGSADFTVEDGEVRYSSELVVQRGPVISFEVVSRAGGLKTSVRSELVRSRGRPHFRPGNVYSWDRLDSEVGLSGNVSHEPIQPMANVWAVINCPGYATARLAIEEKRLEWGKSILQRVVLEPEVPLTLQVLQPGGELAQGAQLRVDPMPVLESTFYWIGTEPTNPAVMEGLGAGEYYASVTGHGYLNSQFVLVLEPGENSQQPRDLLLNPGLGVNLALVWEDGTPAVGVIVSVRPNLGTGEVPKVKMQSSSYFEAPVHGPLWTGQTDASGRVVLSGFQRAKSFEVFIQSKPAESEIPEDLSRARRLRFVRENTIWANYSGWPVQLEPTQITLLKQSPGIQGQVLDDRGQGVGPVSITAYADCDGPALEASLTGGELDTNLMGEGFSARFNRNDGGFSIGRLRAGKWSLLVTSPGHASQVVRSVDPAGDPLRIVLPRLSKLAGAITSPQGKFLQNPGLTLVDAWGRATQFAGAKFDIEDLTPGSYAVYAYSDGLGFSAPQSIELIPGETLDGIECTLVGSSSLAGSVHPSLRNQNLQIRVKAAPSNHDLSMEAIPDRVVPIDPSGTFLVDNVVPTAYSIEAVYTENLDADYPLGLGFEVKVSVLPGQEAAVEYGPGVDALELKGKVDQWMEPFSGWLYFEDTARDRLYTAPVDKRGKYNAWIPAGNRYHVYACQRPNGLSGDDHIWVAADWDAPSGALQKDWSLPDAQVRLRFVDPAGALIPWASHDQGLSAYWYADHDRQAYGWQGTIGPGGILKGLLPGGSYRIHLEWNDLAGNLLEARDVLFGVPEEDTRPFIDIPCVGYWTD